MGGVLGLLVLAMVLAAGWHYFTAERATALIATLRAMARRWRAQDELADSDVPYGPRGPLRFGEEVPRPPAGEKVRA